LKIIVEQQTKRSSGGANGQRVSMRELLAWR